MARCPVRLAVTYVACSSSPREPRWAVYSLGGGAGRPTLFPGPSCTDMGAGSRPQPAPATGAPHPTQPPELCEALPRRRHGATQSVLQPPRVDRGAGDTGMLKEQVHRGVAATQAWSWEGAGARCYPHSRHRRAPVGLPEPEAARGRAQTLPQWISVPGGCLTPAPLPKDPHCPQEVLEAVGRRALRGPGGPGASVGLEEGTWQGVAVAGRVVPVRRTRGRGMSRLV